MSPTDRLITQVTSPAFSLEPRIIIPFRPVLLRRYIFNSEGGQDRSGKSEKISMTSPVKAEMLGGGYKVRVWGKGLVWVRVDLTLLRSRASRTAEGLDTNQTAGRCLAAGGGEQCPTRFCRSQ